MLVVRSVSGKPNLATNRKARPPNARAVIAASRAIRGVDFRERRGRALAASARASAAGSGGLDVAARFARLSFLPVRSFLRATGSTRLTDFSRREIDQCSQCGLCKFGKLETQSPSQEDQIFRICIVSTPS